MKRSPIYTAVMLALVAAIPAGAIPANTDLVLRGSQTSAELSSDMVARTDAYLTKAVAHATGNVAVWTCTFGSTSSCIIAAAVSLLSTFFAAYYSSDEKRSVSTAYIVTDFPPVSGCDLRCMLRNNVADGNWHLIGNATHNDILHSLEYIRMDSGVAGLRARSIGNIAGSKNRRQAENDSGGITGEYYWDDGNENAWSADASDSKNNAESYADAIESLVEGDDANAVCVSFSDPNGLGVIDQGIMVFDNDDNYDGSGLGQQYLGSCPTS